MPSLRAFLLPLAAIAAITAAAPAQADELVAEVSRDTPIAAYGGQLAWSAYDAATGSYQLMIAPFGGVPAAAPIAPSRRPFDVTLGPGDGRRIVALYSRCATAKGTRCDIYRYSLASRHESKLSFSSPRADEAWPAQWRDRVVFVRRHAGGKGEDPSCDVPFVKTLSSAAPPRKLDRGACSGTTGLSLRGERIVQITFGSPPGTRFQSQVRLLSVRGGAVKVLARQSSGEESNFFDAPNQSATAVYFARSGVHPQATFATIDLKRRAPRMREVRARTHLTGALARDAQTGAFFYVEGSGFSGDGCAEEQPVPCRLVQTRVSPFSPLPRVLLPALSIASPADRNPLLQFGDPYELSGRLSRAVVVFGTVRRSAPVAGAQVTLLRQVGQRGFGAHFEPTGVVVTTDADGRWSHTLASAPSQPWFTAVAGGTPDLARTFSRLSAGSVSARMTLTASGPTFAGTIAPAQPGRTVHIQRLLSRRCQNTVDGKRICDDRWTTVADVPVDATGTGFAATIAAPQPGTYSASLAFEDQQADPAAYGGRSADVQVA
jgi:hypothetical protein